MDIDIERLKRDAEYWDGCRDCLLYGSGRDDCNLVAGTPRPSKQAAPEWNGEGAKHVGMRFQAGRAECELVAIDSNKVTCCVKLIASGHLNFCSLEDLEPIRTKEQQDQHDLAMLIVESKDQTGVGIAKAIIAAGWRKGE